MVSGQLQKTQTLMSCTIEPAKWSSDTDQRIQCFDRCQLIITWMSNIKELHGKPQPRSQGLFSGFVGGREKTLALAGHVSILHPEILGVIN